MTKKNFCDIVKTMKRKLWTDKLRNVYDNNFEQFQAYARIYKIHRRLGFDSISLAWEKNPTIQGSVNPFDLRVKPE